MKNTVSVRTGSSRIGSVSRKIMGDVTIRARIAGEDLNFNLMHERIDLGPAAGWVDYFSFNGSRLRDAGKDINGAAITAAFRASWDLRKEGPTEDDRRTLLMAEMYRALGRVDAIHRVYINQYLHSDADRLCTLNLSERQELRTIVESGRPDLVHAEIENLFLQSKTSATDFFTRRFMLDGWLQPAMNAWRAGTPDGLNLWKEGVAAAYRKLQRRSEKIYAKSGHCLVHPFLRFAAYEAFVEFQRCASEVWAMILPGLQTRFALSAVSIEFMRGMHAITGPAKEPALGDHTRGFLYGQALSLHPVGRWLLDRPSHLASIGTWLVQCQGIGEGDIDRPMDEVAYQDVLFALLCSAHEYARARKSSENRRNLRTNGNWKQPRVGSHIGTAAIRCNQQGEADLLDTLRIGLLDSKTRDCPVCNRPLQLRNDSFEMNGAVIDVTFQCECGHVTVRQVDHDVLKKLIGISIAA